MLDSIHHRYVPLAELRLSQPGELGCLSSRERDELARFRDSARREAWLLGRWLCKKLIRETASGQWTKSAVLEILSRDDRGRAVRPQLYVNGLPADWALSISHSERGILAAAAQTADFRIGADLTLLQPLGAGFASTWFTQTERRFVSQAEPAGLAACWSLKEAIYKACNDGDEGFAPLAVEVVPVGNARYDCTFRGTQLGDHAEIRTWKLDGQIAALVAVTAHAIPERRAPAAKSSALLNTEH